MTDTFDIVIVGGGPAGYAAALYGASAGLDIALVERAKVGGTCLHVGCIPAKELLETAAVRRAIAGAGDFGISAKFKGIDMSVVQDRKNGVIDRLTSGLAGLLKGRKVTVFDGTGSLQADLTVSVSGGSSGEVRLSGAKVVLAAGSVPRSIPGLEVDGTLVVTSDELLSIDRVPDRSVVIGGGAIGCEFASMLSDLGSEVTIVEALEKILPGCDADVTKAVQRAFKKRKIAVKTGKRVSGHIPSGHGTSLQIEGEDPIDTDVIVVAVGRRPFVDLLGLESTPVTVDERGFVAVDQFCRTTAPGVYAIGDIIDTPQLAHVAFAEGMLIIKDILGEQAVPIDYAKVPWAIYCHPEVAFAGHSEESAIEAGYQVVTSSHRFMSNGRAMIINDTEGLVKVIAEDRGDGTGGTILGVHMVGPWVTEQLGQGYLALNWEATVDEVAAFIQPHPTLSELFGETVLSLTGRSLHG